MARLTWMISGTIRNRLCSSCKVTEFTTTAAEDGSVKVDSTKYYRTVVINFHGKDYDKYTVNMYED